MKGNKMLTLRQRFADAVEKKQAILDKVIDENRVPTEEEKKELDALDAAKRTASEMIEQLTQLNADLAAVEDEDEDENRGSGGAGTPAAQGKPKTKVIRENGEDENGHYRPFRSLGDQLLAVYNAVKNPHRRNEHLDELDRRAVAGMSEGVGADGGFLLQDDFSSELLKNSMETGLIAPRCRRFPTSPGSTGVQFPVLQETSRVEGSRWGGVQVYRVNEAAAATAKKAKFALERMGFEKLIGMFVATDELLADATFLGAWMGQAFQEEFACKIDTEIVRGTGAGQMKGIINAGCLVTVSKESSQAAASIVGMNVIKMFARLFARSQANAVWLANQDCFPQIATLTITKDKSDIPLYSPPNLIAGQVLGSILGRPVIYVEQCSTVGTIGDLILADLSRYMIIEKDPQQASSIHVYFDTEQTAYRFSVRNNGQPMLKQAITPMNGSATLTDFVVLETRS